ncbi:diguanylate cyclase/phosphodiesterase [Gluconobacter thailandicus F149-1 = NBRC 100600]|nr:diguanylate cyclase [Gluconobacter thailandicus]KXV52996.1 diguanylate cyclase [Gluconobacter thailandicus]GAN93605.1 diguanylate cyclase/phosphodiesterase [Gluconobacter thailandicus F149-1 = NBRC 100600]GBR61172.1 diguanylate cyclase [Gluconobacter thailandicus F149-1 = NBRC 100600]GEL86978.1 diguanylate cyclase [Gluconobacter thailandicus F149-1 = NBRC 100600]
MTVDTLPITTASLSPDEMEWQLIIDAVEPAIRLIVADIVEDRAPAGVEHFYSTLLNHPEATPFLSNQIVNDHLHAALLKWCQSLFTPVAPDLSSLVATQRRIGLVHARIRVPLHVVMHGARLLKSTLRQSLFESLTSSTDLAKAIDYVENMMDLAIEMMSREFVRDLQKEIETDEAYRLVTLGQDVTLEREIQRAALLDWGHKILLAICCNAPPPLPLLEASGFGLWLNHKGSLLFPNTGGIEHIKIAIRRIDQVLIPSLATETPPAAARIHELQAQIEEIRFLMDDLFKKSEALESGRDPLTCTLNRRFLPTIMAREVAQSIRRKVPFSILMIDIDYFKAINDRYGHTGGDAVLREVAEKLIASCRTSDFIFRYGGEEFLVALVETDLQRAFQIAESIRESVTKVSTQPTGTALSVTVSIGVAHFEGHPDYTHLIEDADRALYYAKERGRNCTVIATPDLASLPRL